MLSPLKNDARNAALAADLEFFLTVDDKCSLAAGGGRGAGGGGGARGNLGEAASLAGAAGYTGPVGLSNGPGRQHGGVGTTAGASSAFKMPVPGLAAAPVKPPQAS